MRAGLDRSYITAADLPSAEQLFVQLLPKATAVARRYRLDDPEAAAADALTEIVVERRYQDRWNPDGKGSLSSYLYGMMSNRLLDNLRRQKKRHDRESLTGFTTSEDDRRPEPAYDDTRMADAELLASVGALRDLVAVADTGANAVPLVDLFNIMASGLVTDEPWSIRALAAHFGVSRDIMARTHRQLCAALANADG